MKRINDFIEYNGVILAVGDFIESFIEQNGTLSKGPVANTNQETTEYTSISFYDGEPKIIFCGHKSGNLTAWVLQGDFISFNAVTQLHSNSLNKIFIKGTFIITGSSDKFLKVFNLAEGFIEKINLEVEDVNN